MGVTQSNLGDRVYYHGNLTKKGGFAQYALTTAHTISKLPDSISFEEAAALPCAGFTAYQALHRKLNVKPNCSILIHGGAGGVGGFAIQLAKLKGLTVITTASKSNHDYVKQLGANYTIDYNHESVKDEISNITNGNGVDYVLDTVNGSNATNSLALMGFNG